MTGRARGVRDWRLRHLAALWAGALVGSIVVYAALGAWFLTIGLTGSQAEQRRLEDPWVLPAFFTAVLTPLLIAAAITWRWFRSRRERRRAPLE